MANKGFRIGRLFGIKINVDWSWILIFLLVTWSLTSLFAGVHPEWDLWLQITLAVVASFLFFASVLAHEMAHSLMAVSQNLPVRSITLFLFGGVSNIEREPPSPRAEFLITIVGPLTSILLGIVFILLAGAGLEGLPGIGGTSTGLLAGVGPIRTLLLWLGPINIILGLFNLVPGFPLDGGRILRSILWATTGSLQRATRWASFVGQAIAWLLIIAGIAMVFGLEIPFFGSGLIGGLWLAFIGWFLNNASVQSYRRVVLQDLLEDVPVAQIMRRNPPTVKPDSTIGHAVYNSVMGTDDHAFPVLDREELVGIVCLHDIRAVDRDRWDRVRIREVMTPRDQLVTVTANDDADEALNRLQRQDVRQLPVVDNGHLAGVLRRQDIMRYLQLQADEEQIP